MSDNAKAYCKAVLPHAGLCNRLFTWARCAVYAERHQIKMFETRWAQFKIGHWLRGENDTRTYLNLFQPRGSINSVPWPYQLWLELTKKSVAEPADLSTAPPLGQITLFKGMKDNFASLNSHHAHLKNELLKVTRQEILSRLHALPAYDLTMHIRRGDFAPIQQSSDLVNKGNVQTPIEWFVDTLDYLEAQAGRRLSTLVVSDGNDNQLKPLLSRPEVTSLGKENALLSMLALTKGQALIGSGGSSFTAWAAFLGRMPTVVVPGQDLSWYKLKMPDSYSGVFDPKNPDEAFAAALRRCTTLLPAVPERQKAKA